MGQAKARGSFAVRQAEGLIRMETETLQRKQEAARRDAEALQQRQDAAARRAALKLKQPEGLGRHSMSGRMSRSLALAAVAALSIGVTGK